MFKVALFFITCFVCCLAQLYGATTGLGEYKSSDIVRIDPSNGNFSLSCPWHFGIQTIGIFPDRTRNTLLAVSNFDRTAIVFKYELGTCDVFENWQLPISSPTGFRYDSETDGFYLGGTGRNHTYNIYFSLSRGGMLDEIVSIPDVIGTTMDGYALGGGLYLAPVVTRDNGHVSFLVDIKKRIVIRKYNSWYKNVAIVPNGKLLIQADGGNLNLIENDGTVRTMCRGVYKKLIVKGGYSVNNDFAYILTGDYKENLLYTVNLRTCESTFTNLPVAPWYLVTE
ncbi:hypothetical protein RCL1_005424 [Eukaryota sp. TZLM3-RCL]